MVVISHLVVLKSTYNIKGEDILYFIISWQGLWYSSTLSCDIPYTYFKAQRPPCSYYVALSSIDLRQGCLLQMRFKIILRRNIFVSILFISSILRLYS